MRGIIDSHHHLWQYNPADYPWIDSSMEVLRKDYLPVELQGEMKKSGVEGTVVVQARQSLKETEWLLQMSVLHNFIRGVVGWIDLCSGSAEKEIERYSMHKKFRGVRHVIHDEPDVDFMMRDDFINGIRILKKDELTYDLLLFPLHLPNAIKMVKRFPGQRFVIDHLAKPSVRSGDIDSWRRDIFRISDYPNVWCKISGLVTEADHKNWNYHQLVPYIDAVVEAFGTERIMFGSDWPVCKLAADYNEVISVPLRYFASFSKEEKERVFRSNCIDFYRLNN